jgi:TetR/AcrR family transcriptional repressor of nem operon
MTILDRMVRTRNFDPASALSRAMELFSTRGYSDTSMEQIVNATGVSRYGLYSTFGNKRELFEQALTRFAEEMGRRGFLRLLEPGVTLVDIRALFMDRIEDLCNGEEKQGCLLCHTAMELAPHDEEIQGVLQRFIRRASKTFSIGLETARLGGEVRADLDTRSAGEFLTGAIFGMTVLARCGFDRKVLQGFVDHTLAALTDE